MSIGGLGDRVLLLGRQAGAISTLFAYAGAESGARLAILDVDGSVSPEVHGYFRAFDYRSMLYEAYHLEGDDAMHGQLVASAYAAAMDLAPEEESVLSAALQKLSEQNDLATPSALYDAVCAVEGFRGFYVDKLKGRIGSLRHLDTTHAEGFDVLMRGGCLVSFRSAPYPLACELAADLYIAKVLHLLNSSSVRPDALLVTGAHRLFKDLTRFQHSGRLLSQLLDAPIPLILSSRTPALLNDRVMESMAVRVYSSEAWNSRRDVRWPPALSSAYTACDDRSGAIIGFVPRFIRARAPREESVLLGTPVRASSELTLAILGEVSKFDAANRQSVVSYLAPQFLAVDIGAEVDRLHSEGYLVMEPKQDGNGPKILAYTMTEAGRKLLEELSS
ncbi:MAG: hypothetical protein JRM99_01945 [Nitrososphaerota archaeon]|nr:hypothetical protein [Nitrososphaerota archaeon]